MDYPKKVWVIDVPLPFPFGSAQIRRETPAPPPLMISGKPDPKSKSRAKSRSAEIDPAQLRSRWHLVFAYALGPLYPLLAGWSFSNIVCAVVGVASIGACIAMVGYREELLQRAERDGLGVLQIIGGVGGIILLGFTAWARALFVAGRKIQQKELGAGLRHPGVVAAGSLLFPGLGFFITGNPRRGALSLWILAPLVLAVLILGHAPWLWQMNQGLAEERIPRSALELIFIASCLVGVFSVLSWIIQALEGARLVSRLTGRTSQGQLAALALLAAIVVFHAEFKPNRVAQLLDRFAVALRLEGLRVIPLGMELGAAKLDPSQSLYALHAAELYDKLGQRGRARELRQDLDARWNAYARARTKEPAAIAAAMGARPTQYSPIAQPPVTGPMPPSRGPTPPLTEPTTPFKGPMTQVRATPLVTEPPPFVGPLPQVVEPMPSTTSPNPPKESSPTAGISPSPRPRENPALPALTED